MDIIDDLKQFPIDGPTVCRVLERCSPDDVWILSQIETLAGGVLSPLGPLWGRVASGPIKITTRELCDALAFATQVIILDVRLATDESRELYIDDGELVSVSLGPEQGKRDHAS